MPRKKIKDRAFQEPIHEDAPGFNSNQGHKNLITELNEEVLPSYATDIIGPAEAESALYQFRVNTLGQLEYFTSGEWKAVQGAGGFMNTEYSPKKKAVFTVDAPFSMDCFVTVDIETKYSWGGRDFSGYQYGIRKPTITNLIKPGSTLGTAVYRVMFEAHLQGGLNTLEVHYDNFGSGFNDTASWGLLEEYDLIQGPMNEYDAYVLVKPRIKLDYLPIIKNWAEAEAFGDTIYSGPNNTNGQQSSFTFPQQIWNPNSASWKNVFINQTNMSLVGDQGFTWSYQPSSINLRCTDYGSWGFMNYWQFIRGKSTNDGTFYSIKMGHSSYYSDSECGFFIFGIMNNGWLVLAEYKHVDVSAVGTSSNPLSYFSNKTTSVNFPVHPASASFPSNRKQWTDVVNNYGGVPSTLMFIPRIQGTLQIVDEALS